MTNISKARAPFFGCLGRRDALESDFSCGCLREPDACAHRCNFDRLLINAERSVREPTEQTFTSRYNGRSLLTFRKRIMKLVLFN